MKIYNNIQVYGLQRSGTNFLEWTLLNNFTDVNYKRYTEYDKVVKSPYKGLAKYNEYQSIKHTTPCLDFSANIVAIYKPVNEWIDSIQKSGHCVNINLAIESYEQWHRDLKKVPNLNKVSYSHKEFIEYYFDILHVIQDKFRVTLNENLIQPKKRFNKELQLTNQIFK